jgi:DNA-binding GntR family transcriptional regulator
MASPSRANARSADEPRVLRYQHVYDLVVNYIEERGLQEGDQLPSTVELAELANVSLISVRRALDELARSGKIVRHQGVGIFVAPRKIISDPSRPGSLLKTLLGAADEAEFATQLVSMLVGLPNEKHAAALGIELGQPVWEICRLRLMGDSPKVLEKAVLPLILVPSLDEEHLTSGLSLYDHLAERYGLTDDFVEQVFEVDHPNSWEREHLRLSARDTIVRVRGVSADENGTAFDSFQQTYPASEFAFYVSGSSRQKLLEVSDSGRWSVRPFGTPVATEPTSH